VEAALKPVVAGLETFPAARLPGVPAATAEAAEPPAAPAEPPAAPAEPAPASSPGESLLLPVLAIAIALAAAGLLARRELIGRRAAHE
jgi:hypothetical protein